MIEVQSLSRYYGDFAAIEDLTFQIQNKQVVGFLGLNGAGKSTTLKILATLLSPSTGSVVIDGNNYDDTSIAFRSQIGFLPEEPPLYREMTVQSFLKHVAMLRKMSKEAFLDRLPMVIKQCQLVGKENTVINTLSLGFRKRVGIAQAIIHNPKLIILDEPISGLDPLQIAEMRTVIRSLSEYATVLLSSHNLNEIEETCDRLLILHDGKLVAEGTTEQLSSNLQSESTRVEAELVATREEIKKALSSIASITSYSIEEERSDSCIVFLSLNSATELVIPHIIEHNIGLRSLQLARSELEEIFLSLTKGGQS